MTPATPLRGLPLAVIDTETTGLPPCHVVEVAVVHAVLGTSAPVVVAYTSRVRPPVPVPADATRVHDITDADVADAPTWADVAPLVADACAGRAVVAYNAPFDFAVTTDEQAAIGQPPLAPWPWFDLHVVARHLDKYVHGLDAVAAANGINLDAHGATGDAVATALLAERLVAEWARRLRMAPPVLLGDYLSWQSAAALTQEAEFVAYLRSKGARGTAPDCPWHVLQGEPLPAWPPPPAPTWRVEKDGRVLRVAEVTP